MAVPQLDPETLRLREDAERKQNWKRWGPYLSERQWGTVREDYSPDGNCWEYFSHDDARRRAYRWGEDGLLGFTDRECRLCFSLALWNGRDSILKERLFGLTNPQGNHGEDVKECYYYLDSTPTHSYAKALYKYPQAQFPYEKLIEENRRRDRSQREYELEYTGVFNESRYFDIQVEYAKNGPDDILIRLTAINRGPESAELHLLPTLWFRNSWSWGGDGEGCQVRPRLSMAGPSTVVADHATLGRFRLDAQPLPDGTVPQLIFTENESNLATLFGAENKSPFVKDAFHAFVCQGRETAVNPAGVGTKVAAYYSIQMPAGAEVVLHLRLYAEDTAAEQIIDKPFGPEFDRIFALRQREADEFYRRIIPSSLSLESARVARQAYAGLLWSKQFYMYIVRTWLKGDPDQPKPPHDRKRGRNCDWKHLYARDVLSVPDKWEYPWAAEWDLAFHLVVFAQIDPQFAKDQLQLQLREWYMHPSGGLPAYEFAFGDVNPPVHAWACWRVYKMTAPRGRRDRQFLERCFQKLLLNFTWWVNRKDPTGKNVFSGGFLGLDNIGVFDRSKPLPNGGQLEQADGTAWMAFYCATMLSIALELATENPAYEDIASKFFEHFVAIVDSINSLGGLGLWDDVEGFYYDHIWHDNQATPLKMRSIVGLVPLIAVENLREDIIERLPGFKKRLDWFLANRKDLATLITYMERCHIETRACDFLLAVPSKDRLLRLMRYVTDENEFLSPFGLRSLSRRYEKDPYLFQDGGQRTIVRYSAGESDTGVFGGNSNWRGPVWFPLNFLIIEALERYHHFYGEEVKVEFPAGSGVEMSLQEVARELSRRLCSLFLPDAVGHRPFQGEETRYATEPAWQNLILFYEYFNPETGRGCGASHQTGWTALVARLLTGLGDVPI